MIEIGGLNHFYLWVHHLPCPSHCRPGLTVTAKTAKDGEVLPGVWLGESDVLSLLCFFLQAGWIMLGRVATHGNPW